MNTNQSNSSVYSRIACRLAASARPARNVLPAMLFLGICFDQAAAQSTYVLSNAWRIANGTAHVATGDVNRGLAYSAISNQVFVCNKGVTGSGTAPAVDVFDGTTGALVGSASVTGVSGGNFWLDQVGVANDGILYGANLNTAVSATSFYMIYRWSDWNSAPVAAFANDPTLGLATAGKRVGDTIAITGSGVNTMILAAVNNGTTPTTNMVLFSTLDGTNFTPTVLSISGLPALTSGSGPPFGFVFYT
jgi:hypothetical protein